MIDRTPVVAHLPGRMLRRVDFPRTPVIGGCQAVPLSELVHRPSWTPAEVDAALRLNEVVSADQRLWIEAGEDLVRSSLAYFFAEMIRGPADWPYEGRSLVGRHHREWDEILQLYDRVQLEAARDHGKSHFWSLAYPIWMAGYVKPGSLGYIFSSTQDTASALLQIVKDELLHNEQFAHLIPATGDRLWSNKEITLRNGSRIRARGWGVRVRGGHPQWIVCDDCLSDDDIYSETIRRRSIDYFLSAITNMIVPGGQIIVVGTPMHYGDLYGHLRTLGTYYCKKYPAIDAAGRILFPERYDRSRLERKRRELGVARFAREFLCQPMTDEASLFPSTLFHAPGIFQPYSLGLPWQYWEERGWPRYTGVDFGLSASAKADYTVIITLAIDDFGNRWLANLRRGQGWDFQRQLNEIKDEYTLMRFEVAHIEANQAQRVFTAEVVRDTDIPVRKFFTSGVTPKQPWRKGMTSLTLNKHHLDRGVPSMRLSLENRKWRIPRGDVHSIEATDIWMGEFTAIGWQDGKVVSVGDHDDNVMATWMADTAVRAGGFQFTFGDAEIAAIREAAAAGQLAALSSPEAIAAQKMLAEQGTDAEEWMPQDVAPTAEDMMFGIGGDLGFGRGGF